ncbi:hypothetical protein FGO68_gene8677 [Halteria grandinella]|uniref:Transmembrane protein n=1 Tax=Halteria grandinella TaxID=5974 RepID=A0A8J8NB28_HALGN|nr:hypothetical protein FGO68_gene8677 [Halteria grandinella]
MMINMLTFFINLKQYFKQVIFLVLRKMQGFVYGVREKSVGRNGFRKGMFQQEIFMENQQIAGVLAIHCLQIQVLYLIGCCKAQHTFIIIVMLLAILYFTCCISFQGNTIIMAHKTFPDFIFNKNTFVQVDHAYHRMFRFRQRQKFVKMRDRLYGIHTQDLQQQRQQLFEFIKPSQIWAPFSVFHSRFFASLRYAKRAPFKPGRITILLYKPNRFLKPVRFELL